MQMGQEVWFRWGPLQPHRLRYPAKERSNSVSVEINGRLLRTALCLTQLRVVRMTMPVVAIGRNWTPILTNTLLMARLPECSIVSLTTLRHTFINLCVESLPAIESYSTLPTIGEAFQILIAFGLLCKFMIICLASNVSASLWMSFLFEVLVDRQMQGG
jgi:hypothetical protein